MEALIECPICTNIYDATKNQLIPRILRECGHTMCGTCIMRIKKPCGASKNNCYHIRCPICGTATEISGKDDASSLPKNYLAMAIIDQYRERGRREEINNNLVAESDQEPPKCPEHPDNQADMLCTKTDCPAPSALTCSMCRRDGKHINHQTVLFETVFQEHLVRIRTARKSLIEPRKAVLANIDSIKKCETRLAVQLRSAQVTIDEHFRRLSAELNEKRVVAIGDMHRYIRKRDEELRDLLAKQEDRFETIKQKEKAIERVNFGRVDYARNAIWTKEFLETTIEEKKPENVLLPVVACSMDLPWLTPSRGTHPVKPIYRLVDLTFGDVANNNIFSQYLHKLPTDPVSGMLVYNNKALLQKVNPECLFKDGYRMIIYARIDKNTIQRLLTIATRSKAKKIVIGCELTDEVEEVITSLQCSDPRVYFEVVREPETAVEQIIDRTID